MTRNITGGTRTVKGLENVAIKRQLKVNL